MNRDTDEYWQNSDIRGESEHCSIRSRWSHNSLVRQLKERQKKSHSRSRSIKDGGRYIKSRKGATLALFIEYPSSHWSHMSKWRSDQATRGQKVTGSSAIKQGMMHHPTRKVNGISSTYRIHTRTRRRNKMISSGGIRTVIQFQITRRHIGITKSPIQSTINPKTFFVHQTSKHLQLLGDRAKRCNENSQSLAQRYSGKIYTQRRAWLYWALRGWPSRGIWKTKQSLVSAIIWQRERRIQWEWIWGRLKTKMRIMSNFKITT